MNQINDKQAYDLLRREGFTASEINRLLQLRRDYTASKQKQAPHAHPLLRFARWCIRVILTDEVCNALNDCGRSAGKTACSG
jgi:hypothetical protein